MKTYGNCCIVTMNEDYEVIENGFITVEKGKITALGRMEKCDREYEDLNGAIVTPGLINGHTHLGLIFLRSMADDTADRLKKFLFPMESTYYDSEIIEIASEYGAYESLLAGTTTVFDMYYEADLVAEVLEGVGIRAFVGQTIIRDHALAKNVDEDYLRNFIEKYKSSKLIKPALAPHAPYSVKDEDLEMIQRLSKEYDIFKMMHIGEMDFEMKMYSPKTPFEIMAEKNFIDDRFIGVHAIHASKNDLSLISKLGGRLVSCPAANMKAGKGIPDIFTFIKKDIPVCLGTDGPVSGNTLDLTSVMKLTAYTQKTIHNDRTLLSAREVFSLVSSKAAKVLNLKNLGAIKEGYEADLIFIDSKAINIQPIYDIYNALVYSMNPNNIFRVMVSGNILVDNRKIVNIKQYDKLLERFNKKRDFFKNIYREIASEK